MKKPRTDPKKAKSSQRVPSPSRRLLPEHVGERRAGTKDSQSSIQPRSKAQAGPGDGSPEEKYETPATGAEAITGQAGTSNSFPIIGIGASAGGLAAFETFFAHMPADSEAGISFVIVQHLDPDHKSILSELVRRYTRMRVFEISDGMKVEPNCAYIILPNKDLALIQGKLQLMEPGARRGLRLPVDFFFRSLAQERGEHAIGIILSGNGTDGTLGLRAIKEAGGIGLVQEPHSAEFDGMPRSAITSGLADFVLPPEDMPAQLIDYVTRTSKFKPTPPAPIPPDVSSWLLKIMALLRAHNGHDLSFYKQNTVRRRVERRMLVNQIDTFEHYIRLLRKNKGELDTLFRELLIGVTNFFRDPAAFDAVRDSALPAIMAERTPGTPIRAWVPGCSTGEEAYSLAMLIHEAAEKLGREFVVQVFATDIDHESIEKGRAGVYPANIAADVSPDRLARFFTHEESDFYRVKKTLRDQLIFAEQDVIKDPPFSKLDLISCRNLLIYMEPVLQKRLIPLFHYALAPGGFLLLGNSETVGEFNNLFVTQDRKWKLYRRKDFTSGQLGPLALPHLPFRREKHFETAEQPAHKKPDVREITERMLLRNYSPACVAVNEHGEILYVHGRSGQYLELPAGEASLNLLRAAREGLRIELANALRAVVAKREPVSYKDLEVRTNGGFSNVDVTVELADGSAGLSNIVLVTFKESPPKEVVQIEPPLGSSPESGTPPDEKDRHIAALERDLRIKTETLQTTVEELEAANEELKSTNEELQSTNEELQSTNEELETSKEELQSVNEELVTVNTELQQKMEGLARANNDMNNLLAGTGIGMLFVDHDLRIQRFTPAITQIINLIQSDLGRPVSDIASNLANYDRLGEEVKTVLETLVPREAEVQTRNGHWYLMRMLPYRTVENVIEGAVLTFVDIAGQKRAEQKLRELSDDLERRVKTRVTELATANESLAREMGQREQAEARRVTDISAMRRLHDLTFRIARETEMPKLLQTTLDAAMELTHAKMGSLQLYDSASQSLALAAQSGFKSSVLEHFGIITSHMISCCGDALTHGKPVVVEDIAQSPLFQGTPALGVLQAAGVRSVQTTPVIAREGRLLAIFSTHSTKPYKPDEGTLRLLDLLARQLADLLEVRADGEAAAPGRATKTRNPNENIGKK